MTRLNRVPEATALERPRAVQSPGVFVHEPTGLAFATRYGPFVRVGVFEYDDQRLDASVGYNSDWPGCRVAATFYLVPAPRMSFIGADPSVAESLQDDWLRRYFEGNVEALHEHHPDLTGGLTSSTSTRIGGAPSSGWSYSFQVGDDLSELRVFLFDGQWLLKHRFSYPRACEIEARPRVEALLPSLPWTAAQ